MYVVWFQSLLSTNSKVKHRIMASGCNNAGRAHFQVDKYSASLLSYSIHNSIHSVVQLPEVHIVSNGLILELLRFKDRHAQCTFKILYCWLQDLYGKNWPHESPPTSKAITKSVRRLMEIFQKLKKEKDCEDNISKFLKQEYALPKLQICKGKVLHFSPAKKPQTKDIACSKKKVKEIREKMYAAN